jgi:hypothetical protein
MNESNPAYSGNQLIIEVLDRTDKGNSEAIQYNFSVLASEQNAMDPSVTSVDHSSELPVGIGIPATTIHFLRGT